MTDPKTIAMKYIDACGRGDFDAVAPLLAEDIHFTGPGRDLTGAAPYLAVIRRLGPIWKASQVKKVFTDGNQVCVLYDLVTDTTAGALPVMEWLTVERERISRIELLFDRVGFAPAAEELNRRLARTT